jgi:hypothetical protein
MPSSAQLETTVSKPEEKRNETISKTEENETTGESKEIVEKAAADAKREVVEKVPAPDLRTRVGNAVKAIRGLGGQIEHTDLSSLTDEELQSELEELTEQYKRLKSSKGR